MTNQYHGIRQVIQELRTEYKVVIVSTRCKTEEGRIEIRKWLFRHFIQVDDVLMEKPPAFVYVDDRAICFNPKNMDTLVDSIKNFKTWQET